MSQRIVVMSLESLDVVSTCVTHRIRTRGRGCSCQLFSGHPAPDRHVMTCANAERCGKIEEGDMEIP